MKIKEIEKRILEIEDILSDENRKKEMSAGIPMELFIRKLEKENEPLISERNRLEKLLNFKNNQRQFGIQFTLALVAVFSLLINIWVFQYTTKTTQTDNHVKNRAYLSLLSVDIKDNTLGTKNRNMIQFGIENDGITPAYSVSIKLSSSIDGKEFDEVNTEANQSIISPSKVFYTNQPVPDGYLNTIKDDSNNFLIIRILYSDYSGENHILLSKLQSRINSAGVLLNALGVKGEQEISN
ncbi:MAG: hypothetical protein D4Q79_02190 [Spirochaetia bacterium]|nr:MAG: hypothetical protein D4Q79_02190 [Spirochaetia bacterium]